MSPSLSLYIYIYIYIYICVMIMIMIVIMIIIRWTPSADAFNPRTPAIARHVVLTRHGAYRARR